MSHVLGEQTLRRSIQNAYKENGIGGLGEKQRIVTQSLRGTVVTILLEAGRDESSIMDRTG